MPNRPALSPQDIDRIIEMAWEDRTPFEAILSQFGLNEGGVIQLMRQQLQRKSFNRWRERAHQVSIKHVATRSSEVSRFHCSRQKQISSNKISKRN